MERRFRASSHPITSAPAPGTDTAHNAFLRSIAAQLLREGGRTTSGQDSALHLILGNRSLALARCGKFSHALEDADECVRVSPRWAKAHWRRAQALKGLKRRIEALEALKVSHESVGPQDDEGSAKEREEVEKEIRRVVVSLRREEIAEWIVGALQKLQDRKIIAPAKVEDVTDEEKLEACFRHVKISQQQSGTPKSPYHEKVHEWVLHSSLEPAEAYELRSAMYCRAKCLRQAQADARMAIAHTHLRYSEASGAAIMNKYLDLARAYHQLGVAYTCEAKDHADVDLTQGVKCFSQACEYDSKEDSYQSKLKEFSEQLSPQDAKRVQDLLREVRAGDYRQGHLLAGDVDGKDFCVHQLNVSLRFGERTRKNLTAGVREELRRSFATHFKCKSPLDVQLSFIKFSEEAGLEVGLEIHLQASTSLKLAQEFAKGTAGGPESCATLLYELTDGNAVEQELGRDVAISTELLDITETIRAQQKADDFEFSYLVCETAERDEPKESEPSRPKTEIELPYKMYRLVHADGSPCERADKHGFAMSRVYYSKTELPDEVYVELCDSSLRWRQSSDEVKIILLRVPAGLRASRDLHVQILPDYVKCATRNVARSGEGEVYFEGQLCRGIIPEQSLWEYDSDNGLLTVYLKKMNLELLSTSHQHANMWWPRLCADHAEIQWDDYEKDYSDLPEPIMRQHEKNELQSKILNNLEYKERLKNESLQEADEVRRRMRQERLHEMRTGERLSWVDLSQGKTGRSKVTIRRG